MTVCPNCQRTFTDDQQFIRHRFDELADWFTNTGEHTNAHHYRTKDPTQFHLVNGIIERKVP
jgi:hypothetical protein